MTNKNPTSLQVYKAMQSVCVCVCGWVCVVWVCVCGCVCVYECVCVSEFGMGCKGTIGGCLAGKNASA